ncbi:MAG TPA: hypothetical protein VM032_17930 [Vicinamibacterales bacterium]|nr:hypothetical protein [Vicinamibacterales bacterium]
MRNRLMTALALCLFTAPAGATVIVPADLSELARDATVIARGQVVAVDGQWTEDRRTIETIVTLEAETYLKGGSARTLQFRVPGGVLGRFRNIVVGAPQFAVGQRVVVFLGGSGPRVPHLLGLNQGVYRVGVTSSGDLQVSPPPIMPGVAGPIVRGTAARRPAALDPFEREVRLLAGDGR